MCIIRPAKDFEVLVSVCYTAFIIFSQSLKGSTRVMPTAGGCVVEEETLAYQTLGGEKAYGRICVEISPEAV